MPPFLRRETLQRPSRRTCAETKSSSKRRVKRRRAAGAPHDRTTSGAPEATLAPKPNTAPPRVDVPTLSPTPHRRRTQSVALGRSSSFHPLQTSKPRLLMIESDQSRFAHPNQNSAHRFWQSGGDGARKITPPFRSAPASPNGSCLADAVSFSRRALLTRFSLRSRAHVWSAEEEERNERERERKMLANARACALLPHTHARALSDAASASNERRSVVIVAGSPKRGRLRRGKLNRGKEVVWPVAEGGVAKRLRASMLLGEV